MKDFSKTTTIQHV